MARGTGVCHARAAAVTGVLWEGADISADTTFTMWQVLDSSTCPVSHLTGLV